MRIYKLSQSWYTIDIAKSTKDPQILTDILRRGKNDGVSYYAAENPHCPPEILTEVLRRGNSNSVSYSAADNPNCPPEILTEVLRRGNNDAVSNFAARNPNCPPQAKIKWMRDTGKIGVPDPNNPNHIIEEIEQPKEDDDLKRLKELISKNNNWYKLSQSWYTEEVAKDTKDPQILTNILRRGNNDRVSWNAVYNLSCPPETLTEVLRREKNDLVSWYAAQNPNCPPEILTEVLRKGKSDGVSYLAIHNPNCPPQAKIRWMRDTGKIGVPDPNNPNHIIDKEEVKEDEDLKKLRELAR